MKKRKILILLTSLRRRGPALGGVALAKNLPKSRYDVIVCSMAPFDSSHMALQKELAKAGLPVFWLNMGRWIDIRKIAAFKKFVGNEDIDIVQSYGLRPDIVNAFAGHSAIAIGSVRGLIRSEYRCKFGLTVAALFTPVHIRALKKMNAVVAMSEEMAADLAKEGISRNFITIIPNFVDMDAIPFQTQTKQWPDGERDFFRIGYVGNFNRIKQVDRILKATAVVSGLLPETNVQLDLAGEGPLLSEMKTLARNLGLGKRAVFHGHVDGIYELMKDMDVLVLASSFEGTPRVFMEAMAMGKICLGPDIAGIRTLIENGRTGYLYEGDNVHDLSKHLYEIISGEKDLEPSVIRNSIDRYFSATAGSRKTMELYKRMDIAGLEEETSRKISNVKKGGYGVLERRAAAWLSAHPWVKAPIKKAYRRGSYLIYRNVLGRNETSTPAVAFQSGLLGECFFGYYGLLQINAEGNGLICAAEASSRMPGPGDRLKLYYGKPGKKSFVPFAETFAWNWQQGCMLQWLDTEDDRVVYNDFRNGSFVGVLRQANGTAENLLEKPIAAVSGRHGFALGLNFSRLYHLNRAYGYFQDTGYRLRDPAPSDDGIWYIDLISGKCELLLSLKNIAGLLPDPTMLHAWHKINHLDISPDGRRFMFLHRWIADSRKLTRLVTADVDGNHPCVLADNEMVSHCTWKDSEHILAWARTPEGKDGYGLYTDRSRHWEPLTVSGFMEDGHPSFSPDGRYFVTDTYPDKLRMRSLVLCDPLTGKSRVIGRFFAPFSFDGECRCDLHPRWSSDGKIISFDSCHEGKRNSYLVSVESL